MGNVVQLPPNEKPPELLAGPFEVWHVTDDYCRWPDCNCGTSPSAQNICGPDRLSKGGEANNQPLATGTGPDSSRASGRDTTTPGGDSAAGAHAGLIARLEVGEDNIDLANALCDEAAAALREADAEIGRLDSEVRDAIERNVAERKISERFAERAETAEARVAKLEARLEIDHHWRIAKDGTKTRIEIPPAERDNEIDGIECRDETIKLLDQNIDTLRAARETAERQRDEAVAGLEWVNVMMLGREQGQPIIDKVNLILAQIKGKGGE